MNGVAVGVLGLTDQIRPDAAQSVASLTALTSAPPLLLTGDNGRAATRVARQAGITDVRAALLPEQKVDVVRGLQAGGHRVLVVGDGVNDAPAMAAARTSIAMGAGADLTLQTADGVTVRDELHAIPTLIGLARQARRVVITNLVIATAFITVLVLWDLFGHLPLPLGVAGHEGSTMIVALNGLRLLTNRSWRTSACREAAGNKAPARDVSCHVTTRDLTAEQFNDTINGNDIVLVDFWASWCGPCRAFAPTFQASSEKHPDVVYAKVDTEAEQQLAAAAEIRSIPTLMAFKKGKLLFNQAGALPPAALEDLVQQVKAFDVDAAEAAAEAKDV